MWIVVLLSTMLDCTYFSVRVQLFVIALLGMSIAITPTVDYTGERSGVR